MRTLSTVLLSSCMIAATSSAFAMDDMKKDAMGNDTMTMQQCKDHMAMSKKAGAKRDDAMMKKDTMCSDMMKNHMGKDGMARDGGMKKNDSMSPHDRMASQPMSK